MKRASQVFIYVIVPVLLVVGCSTRSAVTGSGQRPLVTTSLPENKQQVKPNSGLTSVSVTDIIKDYIPKPFNPIVHSDSLEFRGKWAGSIMPSLTQEMVKKDWILYDGLGAKKFYAKDIKGHKVRISIVPTEKGGPHEKDATTIVKFELVIDN